MDRKRKLELICGVITCALGIGVTFGVVYVTELTAQMLHESPPILSAIFFGLALYLLPSFLVAVGSYAHAVKSEPWGRIMVVAATLFLIVLLLVSLVSLVWSRWVLLSLLEVSTTLFAILTSVFSLLIRTSDKAKNSGFGSSENHQVVYRRPQ
jgi:hypothetical protein